MINTAIILTIGIGLWQLAIGSQSWPAWAILLAFLALCKVAGAGKPKPQTKKRNWRHW